MGLDQFAYKVKSEHDSDTKTRTTTRTQIAYWRKHNRLQGWMESLFSQKGGDGTFNCVDVWLEGEDLDKLEVAILGRELPETGGFFFGNDSYASYDEWYKEDDLEFIKKAREALKDGWEIVYDCWW